MNTRIASLVLAASAPAALAFQPSGGNASVRPSLALQMSLRDIASFTDGGRMMGDFEAFDRNGAFSRSPQGGMYGRGGGGMMGPDRMYTRDGFDPFSAYGNSFGMSQSGRHASSRQYDMMYGGPDMMMMGGGPGMNSVRHDNTMGGFDYSSRVREYGAPRPFDYDMGMGGFDGPMGGGMDFDQGYGRGGGYGGFDDRDMSRLGP